MPRAGAWRRRRRSQAHRRNHPLRERRARHCPRILRDRNHLRRRRRTTRNLRNHPENRTEKQMTNTPETETFRRAFDFALDNLIVALKEAQDYLGGGNDLAAIGTLNDIDE